MKKRSLTVRKPKTPRSPLDPLLFQDEIGAVLKDVSRAPGSFATSGLFHDAPNPTIYLNGVGNIGLPLTTYDFNPEDNSFSELTPSGVKILNPKWDAFLNDFVSSQLGPSLGVSASFGKLSATLANVTIQGSGAGAPKSWKSMSPTSFAQLLIILPSVYTGGQYSAKRGSKDWSHKHEGNPIIDTFWIACYNEIPLTSEPLIMGQRLIITYEICSPNSATLPSISYLENSSSALSSFLSRWDNNIVFEPPNRALIPLNHWNSGNKLKLADIPESQRVLATSLIAAAKEINFSIWLVKVHFSFRAEDAQSSSDSQEIGSITRMRIVESRLQPLKEGRLVEANEISVVIEEAVKMDNEEVDARFTASRPLLTIDNVFPVDYFQSQDPDEYFTEGNSASMTVVQRFSRVGLLLCPPSKIEELNHELLDMKDHRIRISKIEEWTEANLEYARKVMEDLETDDEDAKQLALAFLASKSWDLLCELIHMKRTKILTSIEFMTPKYWTEVAGVFAWAQVKKTIEILLASSDDATITKIHLVLLLYKKYAAKNQDLERLCVEQLATFSYEDIDLRAIPYFVLWCEEIGAHSFLEVAWPKLVEIIPRKVAKSQQTTVAYEKPEIAFWVLLHNSLKKSPRIPKQKLEMLSDQILGRLMYLDGTEADFSPSQLEAYLHIARTEGVFQFWRISSEWPDSPATAKTRILSVYLLTHHMEMLEIGPRNPDQSRTFTVEELILDILPIATGKAASTLLSGTMTAGPSLQNKALSKSKPTLLWPAYTVTSVWLLHIYANLKRQDLIDDVLATLLESVTGMGLRTYLPELSSIVDQIKVNHHLKDHIGEIASRVSPLGSRVARITLLYIRDIIDPFLDAFIQKRCYPRKAGCGSQTCATCHDLTRFLMNPNAESMEFSSLAWLEHAKAGVPESFLVVGEVKPGSFNCWILRKAHFEPTDQEIDVFQRLQRPLDQFVNQIGSKTIAQQLFSDHPNEFTIVWTKAARPISKAAQLQVDIHRTKTTKMVTQPVYPASYTTPAPPIIGPPPPRHAPHGHRGAIGPVGPRSSQSHLFAPFPFSYAAATPKSGASPAIVRMATPSISGVPVKRKAEEHSIHSTPSIKYQRV